MNEVEKKMVDELDDKRLAELFLPGIKKIIHAGGGAEAILKQSEAMAACRLSTTAMRGTQEAALKAAIAILDRTQGRPVERRLNIFADVAEMSDEQLDREIYQIAKRAGVREEVLDILAEPIKPAKLIKRTDRISLSSHMDGSAPLKNTTRKKKKDAVESTS